MTYDESTFIKRLSLKQINQIPINTNSREKPRTITLENWDVIHNNNLQSNLETNIALNFNTNTNVDSYAVITEGGYNQVHYLRLIILIYI